MCVVDGLFCIFFSLQNLLTVLFKVKPLNDALQKYSQTTKRKNTKLHCVIVVDNFFSCVLYFVMTCDFSLFFFFFVLLCFNVKLFQYLLFYFLSLCTFTSFYRSLSSLSIVLITVFAYLFTAFCNRQKRFYFTFTIRVIEDVVDYVIDYHY